MLKNIKKFGVSAMFQQERQTKNVFSSHQNIRNFQIQSFLDPPFREPQF